MLHVVARWRVDVTLSNGTEMRFWVNTDYISNVLQKVAEMQFEASGLDQPKKIVISGPVPLGGDNPAWPSQETV
jgi:hypothetical protein